MGSGAGSRSFETAVFESAKADRTKASERISARTRGAPVAVALLKVFNAKVADVLTRSNNVCSALAWQFHGDGLCSVRLLRVQTLEMHDSGWVAALEELGYLESVV